MSIVSVTRRTSGSGRQRDRVLADHERIGKRDGVMHNQRHFRRWPQGTQPHSWAGIMDAAAIGARQILVRAVGRKPCEAESP